MNPEEFLHIVPAQYTGKELSAEAFITLQNEDEAKALFSTAKNRLLDVNNWHHVAGIVSARFQLVAPGGEEVNRPVQKGDYFRVDIPGPGSKEGDGYDWVRVEDFEEVADGSRQLTGLTVRPSPNPFTQKEETAHFYSGESTSSFIVAKQGEEVKAVVIDRNLSPNNEGEAFTDKLRHTAIGTAAIGQFSKIQWQNLANGLVKKT